MDEDFPYYGHDADYYPDFSDDGGYDDVPLDGDHDSTMTSIGWGTDEDYGDYGDGYFDDYGDW